MRMMTKRQIVLYGTVGIVLAVALLFFALGNDGEVSDTATTTGPVSTFEPIATTSTVREPTPSVPAPEPFRFEVVTDKRLQAKGLSGRADIPPNYGMLFVFPEKAVQRFWMKDMLASIDIIWISDELVIVGVDENIAPSSYPNVFTPPEPVRYVLETKAGEARRLGLTPGVKVNLPLP